MTKEDILIEGFKSFARAYNHSVVYLNHDTFKEAFKKAIKSNGILLKDSVGVHTTSLGNRFHGLTWKVRLSTIMSILKDCGFYIAIVDRNGYLYPFTFGRDWKSGRKKNASTTELFERIEQGTDSVHESEGVGESE